MPGPKPDYSLIIQDNEEAVAKSLQDGNYVQAFLLVHALIESLLRLFLDAGEGNLRFADLIGSYEEFLANENYPIPTFVDELTKLNQRRNRIVHELWRNGFSRTNGKAKSAAHTAVLVYGLFIEWLQIFDPGISQLGFRLSDGS